MTIQFFWFERIYCWLFGHNWCRCPECEGGSYSHCKRCFGKKPEAA